MTARAVLVLVALCLIAAVAGGVAGAVVAARRTPNARSGSSRPLFTAAFWALAVERAAKTAAQGALLALGAGQLDVLSADLRTVAGAAAGAAV